MIHGIVEHCLKKHILLSCHVKYDATAGREKLSLHRLETGDDNIQPPAPWKRNN